MWIVPKMWQDGECWIIGGGPSFPLQFDIPQSTIKNVCSGKFTPDAYTKYLDFLKDKHVIGVNNAYKLGTIIDIVFFGDRGWYRKNEKELNKRKHLKVTCCKGLKNRKEVKFLDRKNKFGISNQNGYVCWNYNSGAASISLAKHLGVKKIYLLGFDMDLAKGENRSHWHEPHFDEYQQPPFEKHLLGFPKIAEDAKKFGIEILNVSPDSKIDCFPKVSLKDVI